MRNLPTHYPSTSPRKLQTFLLPVSPMAIGNLPGFATQSSWCLASFLEAIWLTEHINSWNLWHFLLLTRSGFKNVLHCCDSGIHTATVLASSSSVRLNMEKDSSCILFPRGTIRLIISCLAGQANGMLLSSQELFKYAYYLPQPRNSLDNMSYIWGIQE